MKCKVKIPNGTEDGCEQEFNVCFDFPPDNSVFESSRVISDDEFLSKINVAAQSNTLSIVSSLDGNLKLEVALFDINGVSVLKDKCVLYSNEKKQIALDDLNNGAYFLQIKSQDKIISKVFYLYK